MIEGLEQFKDTIIACGVKAGYTEEAAEELYQKLLADRDPYSIAENSTIFATVDGVDYYLWTWKSAFCFWQWHQLPPISIDPKPARARIVSPSFYKSKHTVLDVWNGNYLTWETKVYSTGEKVDLHTLPTVPAKPVVQLFKEEIDRKEQHAEYL